VFNASGFSSYSANGTSNLTIWDDSDLDTVFENQTMDFFANFTNSTGPSNTTDGGCKIQEDSWGSYGSFSDMTYNPTTELFNYTTNFTDNGTFNFNVSCYGIEVAWADDSFVIAEVPPLVGQLSCLSRSTGSCLAGETDILGLSNYTNAHAEYGNESSYSYRICCKDTTGRNNLYNNITGHFMTLLNLSNYTNAHTELPNQTNYIFAQYFGADADRLNCTYNYTEGICTGNSVCVATLSNYTNAHVANCSQENYNLTVCCEIQQISCGDNVIANLTLQANKAQTGAGTCFTVTADNIKINCSGYNISGTGSGTGIDISNRENVTIVECGVSGFTDGIAVDPSYNIIIEYSTVTGNFDGIVLDKVNRSTIRHNNISGNTDDGIEAWNSSFNLFWNNTFLSNSGNGVRLSDCLYSNLTDNTFTSSGRNDLELVNSDSIRTTLPGFLSYNLSTASWTLVNESVGEIRYLNTSMTESGTDINYDIRISSNSAFVNSSSQPGLNTSANVTLYGLGLSIPAIEVDYEDDGTYIGCSAPACSNLSYSGGTFVFNTTHFTAFRAGEADTNPPNITLLSPPNNTLNTTTNNIDFAYNVTDDLGVENCSLIIDGSLVITNNSIDMALATQTFNYSISNGQHNWSVNCTDNSTSNNVGASEIWNISANYNSTPQFNNSNAVPNITFAEDTYGDSVNLTEHFYDADNDTLYYSGSAQNITFHYNNATGIVNVSADGNFTGEKSVTFTASDTISSNTSNSVIINVTPLDDAPSLVQNVPDQSWTYNNNHTLNLSPYFIEVDGQDLNYSINLSKNDTTNVTVIINNTNKTVTFVPDTGFSGTRYITFIANDSLLTVESNNISLTMTVPDQGGGGGGSPYTPPAPPAPPTPPTAPPAPPTPPSPPTPTTPPSSPVAPSLQSPANIGMGKSPGVACSYVTTEKTEVTTKKAVLDKKIKVPSGFEMIVDPFNVDCPASEYELTLNIPDDYEDLKALRCRAGECQSVIETKTVVEELICGGKVISEIRREETTKREKEYIEPTEFEVILEAGKRINPSDTLLSSGNYIIQFIGTTPTDLYARLKRPDTAVPQPKNPTVNVIGTPIILDIDTQQQEPVSIKVMLPFTPTADTEEDSLAIHMLRNGKWETVESSIDKTTKQVIADIEDITSYIDSKGQVLFAVLGVVCDACTTTKFEKIYEYPGSRDAVILIHGFSSSAKTYQLLIDDFVYNQQPWQIWTFSYPSNMVIDELAVDLAEALEKQASQYDNIYIVGHSLGGLVSQQALHLSYTGRQTNPSLYSYIPKVRKAIIMGAPNDGSPAAAVYSNLYSFLMNEQTASKLFNINSAVINELVKGKNIPQIPDVEYYVIAGTHTYGFNTGIFKLSAQQLFRDAETNDGIVTVTSAQHLGNMHVNDMCTNYWEINVSHTDLLNNPSSRKVIERILSEAIADKEKDIALIGFNQYFKLKINDCNPSDIYVVIGKKIDRKKAYDPVLQCSCGNGYCNIGENEFNCPIDCANIIRTETLAFLLPVLIYLVLILTLISSMIYGIYRDYLLHPVRPAWNWFIRAIITLGLLLMALHALMFGPTLYYAYFIELFVIVYLAIGAEMRKKMLKAKPKIISRMPAARQIKPIVRPARGQVPKPGLKSAAKPAVLKKMPKTGPTVKSVPSAKFPGTEDIFDKMANEFEEWKREKKQKGDK
jgi:parallel beta-helix repeat protein